MAQTRCISCMNVIDSPVCPYCGHPVQVQNQPHQLPVGTMLRGRYQVGRVLGQGGFGITYIAWDTLMENVVAVKEFFPSSTVNRNSTFSHNVQCNTSNMDYTYQLSKERFLREAKALVLFRNIPEVVDILDFMEENNTAYIVMEFVRGVDLAKYIQGRGGRLSIEETFRILKPVMQALATVHKGDIVHRDISPDNIILDPMGGAKLLDFGAVRSVEDPSVDKALNKSTEAILKHGFAPIEQYNTRGSLGPWTDEYAMCATVFYCLTGRIPEDASLRVSEGIDPDWDSIPGLQEHQKRALKKGMSVRAKDRYPGMDALMADLFADPAQSASEPVFPAAPPTPVFEPTVAIGKAPKQPQSPAAELPVQPSGERIIVDKRPQKKLWPVLAAVAAVLVVAILAGILLPGMIGGNSSPSTSHRSSKDEDTDTITDKPRPSVTEPQEAPAETTPATTPQTTPMTPNRLQKVALITDGGSIDDMSYAQACWEGVSQWCQSRNIEYTFFVPSGLSTSDYIQAIDSAIAEGADTIVLPGYAFGGALTTVMYDYPDVRFLAVDMLPGGITEDYITYHEPTSNVACVDFAVEESGYLAGYAAVREGYTRLGFLGGMAVPEIVRYGSGFIQGADAAAQELGIDIEIRCFYADQYYGSPAITEHMLSWYDNGTEVVFTCGGGLYTSSVEAAIMTDGHVICADVDLSYLSDQIIASAIKGLTPATMMLLDAANSDSWDIYGGAFTTLSLSQGDLTGAVLSKIGNLSPEEYASLVDEIVRGDRSIDSTPVLYQNGPNTKLIVE